ncbi:hypothetical protein BD779DRAFT_1142516 [Infundibulicybe gibba]|nr:hypothetical protein BD779DRAFT_1142516 [Infundibulicybe gibba]
MQIQDHFSGTSGPSHTPATSYLPTTSFPAWCNNGRLKSNLFKFYRLLVVTIKFKNPRLKHGPSAPPTIQSAYLATAGCAPVTAKRHRWWCIHSVAFLLSVSRCYRFPMQTPYHVSASDVQLTHRRPRHCGNAVVPPFFSAVAAGAAELGLDVLTQWNPAQTPLLECVVMDIARGRMRCER